MNKYTKTKYAGFWTRAVAFFIDFIVLILPFFLIAILFGKESIFNSESVLIFILLTALYQISMLSSAWSATIGKKIVGIRVLTKALKPLDFSHAFKRFAYAILTYVLLLFPVFMLFLNIRKQVLHDFLAETVVIDPYYKKTTKMKLIRGFGILALLLTSLGFLSIVYLNIFVYAEYNSFSKNYHTEDMNDSRIVFYNKELHRYSKGFIEAKEVYEIFEMDTKQNLALTCIRATLREHNISNWLSIWNGFNKNARNTYANTAQSIQKAKQNESYMGQHFYEYHLNDVNEIVENIIHVNTGEKNTHTCDRLLPVEKMYNRFIRQYIYNRREDLKVYKEAFDKAPTLGQLNKAFYHKQIEQGIQWLKLLYAKHPILKKEKQ